MAEQMVEVEQIRLLLLLPHFWDRDRVLTFTVKVGDGFVLEIVPDPDGFRWRASWPDGHRSTSKATFDSVRAAKSSLRRKLAKRMEFLDSLPG
jgi:hypothetical protein